MSAPMDYPDGLSAFDAANVGRIVGGHGTWFHAHLLRLCARADAANLARLAGAFPETVAAFRAWNEGSADAD